MINYSMLSQFDTLSDDQQANIINDFVCYICSVPSDIRSGVYCEELRNLIIFVHKERMKKKPITPKANILQGVLFAVVIELQRRNVYLSEEQYKSIAKQFSLKPPFKHISDPYLVEKIKPFVLNENCHKEEPPQIDTELADLANLFRDDTETDVLPQYERLSKEQKAKELLQYYRSIKCSVNSQSITRMIVDRMFELGMDKKYMIHDKKNNKIIFNFNQTVLCNILKNHGICIARKTFRNSFISNYTTGKYMKNYQH